MPRTLLTVQESTFPGAHVPTWTVIAAADGAMFPNDGTVQLLCRNTTAGGITVTVVSVAAGILNRTGDLAVAVPNGSGFARFNVLPPFGFNQMAGSDAGMVYVNVSADNIGLAVVRLARVVQQ